MNAQVFALDGQRAEGMAAAQAVLHAGGLVVLPTDTVYGVAADAFQPSAVAALLAAKKRDRGMPVPVLIGAREVLPALASAVPPGAAALVEALWPGGLTIIVTRQPSLAMDLGEAGDTIAIRMPDHEGALELLARTGPLAVSSANVTGAPPAVTCDDARAMLGDSCAVYLDGGPTTGPVPSSIVDFTSRPAGVLVREGAHSLATLRGVWPDISPL